jgi:hypothetical protein
MSDQLKSTFKSQDTEEWLDIHFTRPIGYLWARLFMLFDVHPNVVTILSIILGAAAGVCFYFDSYFYTILGILLLMWANFYDSCDGQMARLTGKKTLWGRILDGFAGDVWFFTIYAAICLRLQDDAIPFLPQYEWDIWIWAVAALSGLVCHAKQCQLADYYRNIHLYFLKGKKGSELDNSRKVAEDYAALSWKTDGFYKIFLFFYRRYTLSQEEMSPRFQQFKQYLDVRYQEEIPISLREEFRAGSLPLMKWANILTFNTRAIVLYLSMLAFQPWIYFIFELTVMNVIWWYMRSKHEALCARLIQRD